MSGKGSRIPRHYLSFWHVLALILGFAVAVVIFRYSGDADVILAAGTGAVTGGIGYLLAWFHLRQPRDL